MREVLANAGTAREVANAAQAEARRITGGRYVSFDFTGSHPTTAAEHAEGILRGLERFPRANLQRVQTVKSDDNDYAHAHAQGDTIRFNSTYASRAGRQKYLDSLAEGEAGWDRGLQTYGVSDQKVTSFHTRNSGSPVAVALHEFGHVVDIATTRQRSSAAVHALVSQSTRREQRKQTLPGTRVRDNADLVQRSVSGYAMTNSKELVAEAFTDVMVNGSSASRLSSGIMDALETEYGATYPSNRQYKRDKDGKFSSGGGAEDAAKLTRDDFVRPGETDTYRMIDGAAARLAAEWNPDEADLDAWIAEEPQSVRDYFAGKSLQEKREGLAHSALMGWQGSAGGAVPTAAITGVADRLGARYKLAELENQDYIRERPALRRPMESLGETMYAQTQSWFAERGITHVQVQRVTWRGEAKDTERPFTCWSAEGSSGYYGEKTGSTTTHAVVPVERVFSIPPTGFGTLTEMEFVLLPPLPGSATNYFPARLRNAAPDVDLSRLQAQFEANLNDLLRRWTDVTASQRDQIVSQVRFAITSNDLNALASMNVSTTEAAEILTEAMGQMALDAAREMSREAMDQGVRIDPVASDTGVFAATAVALSALLAQGLTNAAGREALRQWSPATGGDEVAAAVSEHLASLSTAFIEANLSGALMSALTTGRMETALAGPSAALYASEQMDSNTCLAPWTVVTTRRGSVPAELVRADDELLTHAGRWVRPSHLLVTEVDEDLIALRLEGERQLLVTWDHPVLVVERDQLVWRHAGQITEGALVLDQSSLEGGAEIDVPDLDLGQSPHDVAALGQFGGLAPVDVRAKRVPVAAVRLDDELADQEIDDPTADLGLRREREARGLQLQPDGALDGGLHTAGHVAPLAAVSPHLRARGYDPEPVTAVFAVDANGRPAADLAAVGADRGTTVAERSTTASADLVSPARRSGAGPRAEVVPLPMADRDAEVPSTVGTGLGYLSLGPANLGQQLRVGELARDGAVDRAGATATQDLVLAHLAEPGDGADPPAFDGGVLLASCPPMSNGDTAVRTRVVHGFSVVRVADADRVPHRGFVYDFTIPGDETFWAEGVLVHNCKPCRHVNGKWIGNTDDPDISAKVQAVYPNGGYRDCQGGVRCRGTVVSVYRPEQGPTTSVTVG